MDAARVALRFRDTTPGIKTIAEHVELIERQGAVWWGWWRKDFEPTFEELFASLAQESRGRGSLLIIDRSTKRLFRAAYLQATIDGAEVDDARIPLYYRAQRAQVSGWFLLQQLTPMPYDDRLDARIGNATLLILDGSEAKDAAVPVRRSTGHSILHISDLHFGGDYAFLSRGQPAEIGEKRSTLTHSLVEDLGRLGAEADIGLIVVTGDFTTRGDWSDATRKDILLEFQELTKALRISSDDIVCVPGNHDIVRFPANTSVDVAELAVRNQTNMQHEREYRTFLEELTGRSWRSPLNYVHHVQLGGRRVVLCVLNSCTITATQWTEYGYVGTSGIDALKKMSTVEEPAASLKIVALHHHVIPVANIEAPDAKGVSLTLDSVALLDAALNNGAHLVLHGHQHQARLTSYGRLPMNGESETRGLIIVSGGSTGATAPRLPGSERNTYSLLRVSLDSVQLTMRELRPDARAGATLYSGRLPL
jgi:predicted MPP superfamily phosphohydrolase